MKKVFWIVTGLVVLSALGYLYVSSNSASEDEEPLWRLTKETDEMTDMVSYMIENNGITKGGNPFYLVVACRRTNELVIVHNNSAMNIGLPPTQKSDRMQHGVSVNYRVGELPLMETTWKTTTQKIRFIDAKDIMEIRTFDPELITNILSGLENGKDILLQYDNDISRVSPDDSFKQVFSEMKSGCNLFN